MDLYFDLIECLKSDYEPGNFAFSSELESFEASDLEEIWTDIMIKKGYENAPWIDYIDEVIWDIMTKCVSTDDDETAEKLASFAGDMLRSLLITDFRMRRI